MLYCSRRIIPQMKQVVIVERRDAQFFTYLQVSSPASVLSTIASCTVNIVALQTSERLQASACARNNSGTFTRTRVSCIRVKPTLGRPLLGRSVRRWYLLRLQVQGRTYLCMLATIFFARPRDLLVNKQYSMLREP